jgi:peptide deformylase
VLAMTRPATAQEKADDACDHASQRLPYRIKFCPEIPELARQTAAATQALPRFCVVTTPRPPGGHRIPSTNQEYIAMALMNILRYPDPRLHKVAKPVTEFGDRIHTLVADMAETMYDAPGVGLAATQVDVHERVVVIDITETKDDLMVFINPEIVWSSPEKQVYDEGCLSVPGVYDGVERPARVKVRAVDADNKPFELEADGLLAVCIQHEMDHLMGKVFVEYLSPLKRNRIKTKLLKEERGMQGRDGARRA